MTLMNGHVTNQSISRSRPQSADSRRIGTAWFRSCMVIGCTLMDITPELVGFPDL